MISLKKLFLFFLVFVPIVLLPNSSNAQNNTIKFTNLSLKEGLTQSSVNCILQDKRGFMWFGTQDGLNRYDGYHFTVFKHDPMDSTTLSDNYVQSMFEDKQGVLWIGTEGGLNKFDREKEQFVRYEHVMGDKNSLSNDIVMAICEDNKANLWIGTANGLNKFDREKETFHHYRYDHKSSKSISGSSIQSLYVDKAGTLWVGTVMAGLNKFHPETESFSVYQHKTNDLSSISNNWVWSIFEDRTGNLWVGTNDGLNTLNRKTGKFERFKTKGNDLGSISHNVIRTIFQDNSGVLWIGTEGGGLNRFEKEKKQFSRFQSHANLSSSLANNIVFDIYEDCTGTLWIGTNGGISKFDRAKQNFNHFRNIPGSLNTINSNVIWSILEDKNGLLWVGTDEGLNRMDRANQSVKHFKHISANRNSHIKESIYSLFEDHADKLWIGTDAGLYSFDRETEKFTQFKTGRNDENGLSNKRVYDIFEDAAHNIWIGTKEGLYLVDETRKHITFFQNDPQQSNSISNDIIRCIYQDKAGTVWIGTNGGGLCKVVVAENEVRAFISYKSKDNSLNALNNNIILSILEDDQGILWLGTYGGGLNKFNPENGFFSHYTEKNGLSNNVIYSLLSDKTGNLWMSTNKGISKFDPALEKFQNYYENDGLQSNEFNIGAYCKGQNGEMFFGGINGFNAFSPELIQINQTPPQIILTDFQIFNKKVGIGGKKSPLKKTITETKEIILSYKEAVITFEFAALHYSFPEKNKFAYMMEGFEEDWNYVDQRRQASYTNLDPGNYIFRVKGSNSDGIWSEEGVALRITIIPPWWKTWWFRTFGLVFILGGFVGVYKSRIKIIESQKRYLEKQVKERTGEILDQKQKIEAQKELLEKEKDKVEKLLLNILPSEMVDELKNKGKASARHYRMASIMFTDFKGFTQIAESIRPKDLVHELDRCFVKFDEIIEKYGLEKIKTIGDSYMCAGGLPIRNKSNPIDIVLAALEIQRFIDQLKQEKIAQGLQHWELRIGINTGELIAGVVGIKRFAYDIWGDSVNIASRMEMHGEVGKVNVSGKTYDFIKDFFDCTYRGKIMAKNKGEIDMYYVDRIKPELSLNNEGIVPNELFRSTLATTLFYKINFKKAEQFILKKLAEELPKDLYYHGIHHTLDVRDAAERIGKEEGLDAEDLMVLKTAAMYHDAGFVREYFKNEPIGVELANEILPNFGYSPDQIRAIEKMIMATQVPQSAKTLLEKILCDADLDYLGRDDFHPIAETLKRELMARDKIKNDKHWDEVQISFLEHHTYFTETSKKLRQPEKEKRIEEIKKRYAQDQYK